MSLSIERNNGLDEFEKAVNDEETTAKISKAFAKGDKEIKKDMEKIENQDVIMNVVRKIRSARTLADAKEILIDNAVTLYHTETFASLIQYSLIEGPNPINLADDPEWVKSFDEEFCGGKIGTEKDPFEGLTDEEIEERLNKVVYLHDGISEEIYIEKSGRIYTLDENGNKIYKTVQEPETGFRYLTKDDIGHFSKFPSGSIKSVQDPVKRSITKSKNGDFDEGFEQLYNETNGFNVTYPNDNLSCGSKNMEEFCDFMTRASKGYSEGVIERRKKSVISLIQDFGKLTPEIESRINACTSVSEIEDIYDEVKATIPKSNDGMIDCVDILNKVSGDEPMTDAAKVEDAEDVQTMKERAKELDRIRTEWSNFLQPYLDNAIAQARADYEKLNGGSARERK